MKNSKANRKGAYLLIGILIVVVIVCFSVSGFLISKKPLEVKYLQSSFIVGESIGFNLNSTVLTFGEIRQGGSGTRKIVLSNGHNFSESVYISATSEFSKYLSAPSNFTISPGENKTISFSVKVPKNLSFGNYTGTIKFSVYRG